MVSAEPAYIFDACRRGDLAQVTQIYESYPDAIHAADSKGFTPLIIAVYNDQPPVVEWLLEKGADTNAQDLSGNTALMGVSFKGYKELADMLLQAGANVNQRNSNGATALTFAATFGHLQIAEMLLKNGADVTLTDARGKTPLDHAWIQENDNMVSLIERYSQTS
jgi:uncharacterized protein